MPLIQYLSRIHFDFGALGLLGAEIERLAIKRPLLITDRGIAAAGLLERALGAARPAIPIVYDGTTENPNEASLEACLGIWRDKGCDGVIALGGGSAIDLAKAVALLATHGGRFADYGVKTGGSEAIGAVARQIAIPTAAGTGAEVGRACVMTLHDGSKTVAVNLNMVADVVICDPDLTASLPPRLTAATGIDALSHAVEAVLSSVVNPPAEAIARDGLARAAKWLEVAVNDGGDREARWQMMMAALQGGMVLQKGLGAAHAMANPLGEGGYHHGTLIGVLLPHAIAFNGPAVPDRIADLERSAGLAGAASLGDWVADLVGRIGLPQRLSELGVRAGDLDGIAAKAAEDHLSKTNPRPADREDYLRLLRSAL